MRISDSDCQVGIKYSPNQLENDSVRRAARICAAGIKTGNGCDFLASAKFKKEDNASGMPLNRWQKKNRSRPLKRGSGRRRQPLCGTAGRKGRKRGSHRWIDGRFWRSGKKKHEYELLWCCSGRSVDYRAAAGCLLIAAVSKAVGSHQILIDPNSSRDVTRTVTSTSLTSRDPRANSLGK